MKENISIGQLLEQRLKSIVVVHGEGRKTKKHRTEKIS